MPPPSPGAGAPPSGAHIDIEPMEVAPKVWYRSTFYDESLWGSTYAFLYGLGVTTLSYAQQKVIKGGVKMALSEPDVYCEMYGCADRTGSNATNFKVAGLRLANVQAALAMAGVDRKIVYGPQHKNLGEEWAATYEEDEMLDPTEREVLIYIWPSYAASRRVYADKPFLKFARAF